MADRTCISCGRAFKYPRSLREHRARKTPCTPILSPQDHPPEVLGDPDLEAKKCRFCGRVFSNRTSMLRHVRHNCKIAPNAKNGDEGLEKLYDHTNKRQSEEIAELKAEMAKMREDMRNLTERSVVVGGGGNIAIQGNVNIMVFGKESQRHITGGTIRAILDDCLKSPAIPSAVEEAVLRTAMLVYSDPDRPENITAYLPNKKTDDVMVHGEKGWEIRPSQMVLRPMASVTIDTLFDNQPHENADQYGPLMQALRDNENRLAAGSELRPILVRNKDLLRQVLKTLPMAGDTRAAVE